MDQLPSKPVYTAPPIIEAVVQLVYAEALSNSAYRKLVKRLKRNYVNSVSSLNVKANVDFVNRSADFQDESQERLSSGDETDILVIEPATITWSRLAPYQGWDKFIERVKFDAEVALEATKHRKLFRIGLRYINRLDVPRIDGIVRYEDYLAINIDIPVTIPVIQNYAWRFERMLPDKKLMAIVQSAVVSSELPDTGAFLLDIDVVATQDLPAKFDEIFVKLEEMRMVKNEHFEISIREKARNSFST